MYFSEVATLRRFDELLGVRSTAMNLQQAILPKSVKEVSMHAAAEAHADARTRQCADSSSGVATIDVVEYE